MARQLPDITGRPLQAEMGWAIYSSHWQVDLVFPDCSVKEKVAYTNFFFAAEAAYHAARKSMPSELVTLRQRARIMWKSWEEPPPFEKLSDPS
jgi:hypothetical protein